METGRTFLHFLHKVSLSTVLTFTYELMTLSCQTLKHLFGGRQEVPWNEWIPENHRLLPRTPFLMVILLLYAICSGVLKIEVIENHFSQEKRGKKKLGRII